MTHASVPPEQREILGITDTLVRTEYLTASYSLRAYKYSHALAWFYGVHNIPKQNILYIN